MRRLRFIPAGSLVEVTARTVHGRLLLRPDSHTRDVILGVTGRAQRLYSMRVVGFVFLSNHFHFLVLPESSHQLSRFMAYVMSNTAREVGRAHDWRQKFWARRYQAIVVADTDAAQVGRMRYLLSHGVKEGLVDSPGDWPGPHCVDALLRQEPLVGTWYDRHAEFRARRMGLEISARDFATSEVVTLDPLPCWANLPLHTRRRAVSVLTEEIHREARSLRRTPPLGRETVLRQHPHQTPALSERSNAPSFHGETGPDRTLFLNAYAIFVAAYLRAAERWRAGERNVEFPSGSFPPAPPYEEDTFARGNAERALTAVRK